jgi:hypothetical protein
MVATQQVGGGGDDMGFRLVESGGCILCQAAMTNAKRSYP